MQHSPERCLRAKKEFQKLWVAGTLGAFFTAIFQTLPIHVQQLVDYGDADVLYTMDLLLRYSFLFWLIAYFFISNLENELSQHQKPTDLAIAFDVIQSFGGMMSAYYLGFMRDNVQISPSSAYAIACFEILVICTLSLLWFQVGQHRHINIARRIGIALSLLSLLVVCVSEGSLCGMLIVLALQIALWIALIWYMCLRLKYPGTSDQGDEVVRPQT